MSYLPLNRLSHFAHFPLLFKGREMKCANSDLRLQIDKANQQMMRKFWAMASVIAATFFLCLLFDGMAAAISRWSATYIPSIAKLRQAPTGIGFAPANFFGVVAVLIPAFAIWLAWGEDPHLRWRYGAVISGRGLTESTLMLYLLGLPFCLFFIFMMYAAPIEMPPQPRLWGQHIVHLMLNTHLGLFALGIMAAISTVLFGMVSLISISLPFAAIKKHFTQRG